MPLQQISVVPARETSSNSKSAPRPRDKNEGGKTPGRSGSGSSNISKASHSTTGLGTASRTPVNPSPQDICSSSQLKRLEEFVSAQNKPSKQQRPSAAPAGSSAQGQKKQVKRRHRRRKDSGPTLGGVADRGECSPSSERSQRGETRERAPPRTRRELPPRLRRAQVESTSDEEGWQEGRSWSREKARRGEQRGRERDGGALRKGVEDKRETMELQSLGSDEEEEENRASPENGEGLKKRHSGGGSVKSEGRGSQKGESQRREKEKTYVGCKPRSQGTSSVGRALITKRYQEKGEGGGDMSMPSPPNQCGINGGTAQPCSEDSELEVCRICHCEGDKECPLIMPCHCTGSLRFVHQTCLNHWIKSSDTRCCELCKFVFIMETRLKPLRKWDTLNMSKIEKRKVYGSVLFHLIAIALVLWSLCILFRRTVDEIQLGKNDELWRISILKYYKQEGMMEWPFWTRLVLVALSFTGSLIFMHIQCKVYLHLWRRLKAYNRIITVQNCPERAPLHFHAPPAPLANGQEAGNWTQDAVAVPVTTAPVAVMAAQADSDQSVEDAVAPVQNPV